MIHRKRRRRLVLVALLAFVLGTTAFAYAANIQFNGGTNAGAAGEGAGTISGYNVTNIKYTLDNNDPAVITGVEFALSPDTATTVKAKVTGMASWGTCTDAGTTLQCVVSGNAQNAVELKVAAAD